MATRETTLVTFALCLMPVGLCANTT